ncbi:phosphonate ABC transporter ATP-binding protein [Photobacterium minamisatsumaniensis]|uniref:phosphonate ABC transporter ATP-binding protein n=1 Tax=Photobacterium minamisatsumaniensis TaxID=2910233 RepID=UPI003D0BE401
MSAANTLQEHSLFDIACPQAQTQASVQALKVRDLHVTFNGTDYLYQGLDLDIEQGDKIAIIGSNGAGKSTLMRACLGIIESRAKEVSFFGQSLHINQGSRANKQILAKVGFVHQKHNIMGRLSVLSNVLHGALGRTRFRPLCWTQTTAPQHLREEAIECLKQVGLADFAARPAGSLSGGQAQRVAIARALMQQPTLIVADEPVASLDPVAGEEIMSLFSKLASEKNVTLVFISHHLSHAVKYADRIIGLKNGKVDLDVASSDTTVEKLGAIYDYA